MEHTKKCEGCVWFDQCAQEVACEDYSPVSDEESMDMILEEYAQDLTDRYEYYNELIEEQNS